MTSKPKLFSRYFFLINLLLLGFFYMLVMLLTKYYYSLPFEPNELLKHLLGSLLNVFDLQPAGIQVSSPVVAVMISQSFPPEIPLHDYPYVLSLLPNGWIYTLLSWWFATSIVISAVVAVYKVKTTPIKNQSRIRGASLGTSKQLVKTLRQTTSADGIAIGDLHLPRSIETRHFLILGTTGTGKSYLLMTMIDHLRNRKIKMILLDRKGEFYSAFGDVEKDKIVNPYDKRHVKWSIFSEFGLSRSFDRIPERLRDMADSLFSVSANNQNAHFYNAAADVFCSAVCYLALQGKTNTADLTTFFAAGGKAFVHGLKTLPPGLAAGLAHLGEDGTDEHSGSILSTLTERCKDFAAFVGQDGDFAVRDWMRGGEGSLYISTAGENDQRYRSITTMLLDIVGQEVKAMPESKTTRLAIVIDELASLPPLKTLSFLLNEGRSKGVCVIIANQTFSKMQEIYGQNGAKNIFANTNSKFIFRLPEPGDAKYISDAIGDQEVVRQTKSRNQSSRGVFDTGGQSGTTISEQIVREAIYLPAQIQNLQRRHAIAMIPDAPIAEIELPTMHFGMRHPLFLANKTEEISAKDIAAAVSSTPPETKKQSDNTNELWI